LQTPNLSEYIQDTTTSLWYDGCLPYIKVKEFIKKVKEIDCRKFIDEFHRFNFHLYYKEIDKLAGDKLI
jgi:hypothetical protein